SELMISIIAFACPSWRREMPLFGVYKATRMTAFSEVPAVRASKYTPSRLERAKQKVRDMLAARAGSRTGLIAFSGTAHLVMPMTEDRAVIEPFLAALTPELMPVQGNNATAAVALATTVMAAESLAGTILVIADGIGDEAAVRRVAGRNGVLMLSVAPPPSDLRESFRSDTVRVSVDGSDIRSLERRIETRYQSAQSAAFGTRWRDEGYWLLLPAALLGLLWFRRGTAVAWLV